MDRWINRPLPGWGRGPPPGASEAGSCRLPWENSPEPSPLPSSHRGARRQSPGPGRSRALPPGLGAALLPDPLTHGLGRFLGQREGGQGAPARQQSFCTRESETSLEGLRRWDVRGSSAPRACGESSRAPRGEHTCMRTRGSTRAGRRREDAGGWRQSEGPSPLRLRGQALLRLPGRRMQPPAEGAAPSPDPRHQAGVFLPPFPPRPRHGSGARDSTPSGLR